MQVDMNLRQSSRHTPAIESVRVLSRQQIPLTNSTEINVNHCLG